MQVRTRQHKSKATIAIATLANGAEVVQASKRKNHKVLTLSNGIKLVVAK